MIDMHALTIPYQGTQLPIAAITRSRIHGTTMQVRAMGDTVAVQARYTARLETALDLSADAEGWITVHTFDSKAEADAYRDANPHIFGPSF